MNSENGALTAAPDFRCTVQKIKNAIGANDQDLMAVMGLSISAYARIQKGKAQYTVAQLNSLCQVLGLNANLLYSGRIDYKALAKEYQGTEQCLPERYTPPEHQVARVRAVRSMYHFTGLVRDYSYANRIFGRLQIRPDQHLQNADAFISPLVHLDYLSELQLEGFSDADIQRMGTMTLGVIRETQFGKQLSLKKDPRTLFQDLFEKHTDAFDQLWTYKLVRISDRSCAMEVRQRESSCDAFHSSFIGNKQSCLFLQGTFSSLVGALLHNRIARVLESECMYKGGSRCLYHLRWD